ncbi:MAG: hypothetical protein HYV29_07425 [Ignavibacteriales bacterium]|nr:hypothetical protein [Ignavibacteriales bacterium]
MAASKQKKNIEYRLLIEHTYDDTLKKEGIMFLLETTKQFTNFSYQIDVKDVLKGNVMHWELHGLRAPSMNMPGTGTAQFTTVYFDIPKTFTFILTKTEKIQAETEIKISRSAIHVSDGQINFLKIYTDRQEFEKNRFSDAEPPEYKPNVHRAPVEPVQPTKKKKT